LDQLETEITKRRSWTPEEVIKKLREVEVFQGQGKTIAEACKAIEVAEQTYYRWKNEYGGLDTTQACRLKELEKKQPIKKVGRGLFIR